VWSKNVSLTDFYNIWHLMYRVNLQQTLTDLPVSLTYCCYTTLGKVSLMIIAYIFQQDCALARRARQMMELLQRETLKFILPTYGLRTALILMSFTVKYGA